MNIIVVGVGKVGYAVAEQLSLESNDVTVVDINQSSLDEANRRLDVICINGNGAEMAVLREAGIDDCDLLIALTGSDEVNLLCCLVAKKLGASETIARIRNPEYRDEVSLIKDTLGLTMAINPEREAAKEIVRILNFPAATNIEHFAKGKVDLISFAVDSGCSLCGRQVKDSFAGLSSRVLACAVERGDSAFIPFGDSVIEENDVLAVLAPPEDINGFFKEISMPTTTVKNVMIIGGGRITKYLVGTLCRHGMEVTVIERNRETAETLSFMFPKANIILGDGTNKDLLVEEGLGSMDALCCLTGLDEENILLSIYAKSVNPHLKTITKVNRTSFPEVLRDLKVGTVIYPKNATSTLILRHVRARRNSIGSNVEALYKIIDNKVEALQFHVGEDSELLGSSLEEMELRKNIIISCISRGNKLFIPHGKDYLKVGDSVIVVTTLKGLSDLDDIKG